MTGNNHANRGWRQRWQCAPAAGLATHESGVVARVVPSAVEADGDALALDNTAGVDLARYDLGRIAEEAMRLYLEGAF